MSKLLYPKLALSNIKKNAKVYVPYILTCILTIGMYYIINSLAFSETTRTLRGGDYIQVLMALGTFVVALFAIIFLFYTNSFLMKRRKKEIGLYNILGMEKKHISIMIFFETLYVALISLGLGLLFGILFHKLVLLLLLRIVSFDVQFGFEILPSAVAETIILFSIIFLATLINNLRQIHLSSPVELLRGGQVGEKEPKSNWLITLIGALSLGGGYFLAMNANDGMTSFLVFFPAVILVIIGTYCLFVSGSVTILKALRNNKRFYYKPNHFISVSGMIYRMKQNAVGLANICILSTMVLVMISSTSWLYSGVDETVNQRYPREIVTETTFYQKTEVDAFPFQEAAQLAAQKANTEVSNELYYEYIAGGGLRQGNNFIVDASSVQNYNQSDVKMLYFMPISYYSMFYDDTVSLKDDEVLVYSVQHEYNGSTLGIFNRIYNVVGTIEQFDPIGSSAANMVDSYIFVMNEEQFDWIDEQWTRLNYADDYTPEMTSVSFMYGYDVEDDYDITAAVTHNMNEIMTNEITSWNEETQETDTIAWINFVNRNYEFVDMQSMFGGFFFLGIFLGSLFVMATVLIMYYKQISEGYEDRERFRIMQNVGMSRQEVKKAVHSQVLAVFFLPLIVAGIHICFAFNLIRLLFSLVSMTNAARFMASTVITFLVFAFFYIVVYLLTARVYEKLVSEK